MLHELHATEISYQKEESVLEQCEQLSSRLREALQAQKEDRYASVLLVRVDTCCCLCAPTVQPPPIIKTVLCLFDALEVPKRTERYHRPFLPTC